MLPKVSHPDLLVGTGTADDAGVFRIDDDKALVQTVDVFTPVVDDPFHYGQISAANSLSDVYAMGGKPLTALNIVGFPKKILELEVLAEILKGAADKVAEAGCITVGGHTVVDEELKFGLSVTGIVHPDKVLINANAKSGDKLILTKPLGIGILSTALKNNKLTQAEIDKVTVVMATLNKTAGELMVEFGANSATDITGFGLMGHLNEMVSGSGVSTVLQADAIPFIPEALVRTKEGGFIPGGSADNKIFLQKFVSFDDGIDDHMQMIFFDAQTSGGLLISIQGDKADDLLSAMHEKGVTDAAIIGEIVEQCEERIKVLK